MKGMGDKPTKLDIIKENPVIAQALLDYAKEKQIGSGMRQAGGSWWDDFVGWLKRNKVISTASKIGGVIATALGNPAVGTALGAASTAANALGYGRRMVGNGYVNNLSKIGTKKMSAPRLMGMGAIYSQNGMLVKQPKQSGGCMSCMQMGGMTTQYNTVSTEFSNVKFR